MSRTWMVGTTYAANDTYRDIITRQAAKPRIYPATKDGSVEGKPVLLTPERLAEKRREMGPYTFSAQMLLNPVADETQGFKREWMHHYSGQNDGDGMNRYVLVDPASSKKRQSDYTAAFVVGLGTDSNYYVLDMVRDRLSLTERADLVFELHRRWKPKTIGYEEYGLMSDREHIEDRQSRENYRFSLTPVAGKMQKLDRIRRLIPSMAEDRWWFPQSCWKTDYEKKQHDLVQTLLHEEMLSFPVSLHDDMLDALSRIFDVGAVWPMVAEDQPRYAIGRTRYGDGGRKRSWMSA